MSNFLSNFFFLQLLHFLKCWKRERIIFISPQDIFSQIFLDQTEEIVITRNIELVALCSFEELPVSLSCRAITSQTL